MGLPNARIEFLTAVMERLGFDEILYIVESSKFLEVMLRRLINTLHCCEWS
jgi:hypothetical protein